MSSTMIQKLNESFRLSRFAKGWLGFSCLLLGFYLGALGINLWFQPEAFHRLLNLDPAVVYQVVTALSRSSGQFLGIALTCLGVALPVTANLYTPRLVQLFLTDRFNVGMLGLILLTLVHNIWTHYGLRHSASLDFDLYVTLVLFFLTLSLLLIYFGHMSQYFNPSFLIFRLEHNIDVALDQIHQGSVFQSKQRSKILVELNNMAKMILKSIDHSDREVALEGIYALKRLLDHYVHLKATMPKAWMELDYSYFTGLSSEGLTEINIRKIWFELLILKYLSQAFNSCLNVHPDLASAIAEQNQYIGLNYLMCQDSEVVHLCIRSFNTYLSSTMEQNDLASMNNVWYQYGRFSEVLMNFDQTALREVIRHIRYFINQGKQKQIIHKMFDSLLKFLLLLIQITHQSQYTTTYHYLCETLHSIAMPSDFRDLNAVIMGKLIYAGFLLKVDDQQRFEALWPQLLEIAPDRLPMYYQELIVINARMQNEMTAQVLNHFYLSDKDQVHVKEIFRRLGFFL
ncbi:DUF2254 family protein [Deltaproteobacteria bacterium TL4]